MAAPTWDGVCPRSTRARVSPGAAATVGWMAAAGARAGAGAGAGSTGAGGGGGSGSGARTIMSEGSACGASITGASIATALCGASTSAEYSRTRRPWPQSTSTRKDTACTSTGALLVTRTTARPWASALIANCRSRTRPVGGCRPTRAKVSAEARRTRAFSSSPGWLEMIGISASSGCPGPDSTRIWPRPSASALLLASNRAVATSHCNGRHAPCPLFSMARTIAVSPFPPQRRQPGNRPARHGTPACSRPPRPAGSGRCPSPGPCGNHAATHGCPRHAFATGTGMAGPGAAAQGGACVAGLASPHRPGGLRGCKLRPCPGQAPFAARHASRSGPTKRPGHGAPALPWCRRRRQGTLPSGSAAGGDQFGQLHRVERGTLADVVGHDPQVQAARVREVLADAAHVHRVVARGVGDRGRVAAGLALVDHFHARRTGQQLARGLDRDLLPRLDRHGLGVAVEHRHAHRGRVHLDAVVAEDLAGLPDQL